MPYFSYKAKDRQGEIISGTLEADSRSSAVSRLQVMGYFPMSIASEGGGEEEGGLAASITSLRDRVGGGIRSRDVTQFYRQMSDLIGAGVPLVKSLGIVKVQCLNPKLKALLSQIDQDVQGGDTFTQALLRHPKTFGKLATAMVQAGEAGGLLEESLDRLADFAEKEEELKGQIASALAYPAIMVVAGGLAVSAIFTFVIPRIVGIFEQLNQTLPLLTQILIAISSFMTSYWYLLLGAGVLAYASLRRYISSERGGKQLDALVIKIPILGELILKRDVARFTRTLGALLRNGVPILNAFEIASQVLTNRVVRAEVEGVPESITQGGGIAPSLRDSTVFPPVVTNMIAIGEETGNLAEVLLRVADSYEGQVDRQMKTATSVIEPLLILVMAIVVAFIVLAMLLPIFELDPTQG